MFSRTHLLLGLAFLAVALGCEGSNAPKRRARSCDWRSEAAEKNTDTAVGGKLLEEVVSQQKELRNGEAAEKKADTVVGRKLLEKAVSQHKDLRDEIDEFAGVLKDSFKMLAEPKPGQTQPESTEPDEDPDAGGGPGASAPKL